MQKLVKEVAIHEAAKLDELVPTPKYYFIHRNDGVESDFFTVFLKNTKAKDTFLLLTAITDDKGKGQIVIQGKPDDVTILGPQLSEILDGKGNGKGGKFQAKVNNLKKLPACEELIKKYFVVTE